MILLQKQSNTIRLTTRVVTALFGGFLLANLVAIIISYLPLGQLTNAIVTGMMVSFIVYVLAVIYVFSTTTTRKAVLGISSSCAVAYAIIFYLNIVVSV